MPGVKVAVIDNGVDGRTPELRNAVVGGRDFSGQGSVNGQAAVASTAGTSHGTEVASVLAGRGTGPTSGVIGSAPRCLLLTASVATGISVGVAPIARAIRWATDAGAKVINLSLNAGSDSAALTSAVRYAESKDVVLVSVTGDEGINFVGMPHSFPESSPSRASTATCRSTRTPTSATASPWPGRSRPRRVSASRSRTGSMIRSARTRSPAACLLRRRSSPAWSR